MLAAVACLLLMTASCGKKQVDKTQLPQAITSFIQENFPGQEVTFIEEEKEFFDTKYDVTLANGVKLDFDGKNEWDKINTNPNPVPSKFVPEAIATHAKQQYPNETIVKINKKDYGYKIKLSNDLELKYTKDGEFKGIDEQ